MQDAIAVYTSDELDIDEGDGTDGNVTVKDWLKRKEKLDDARETLRYLCDPVEQPREVEQYLRYFCGDATDLNALNETEQLRINFYKRLSFPPRLRGTGFGLDRGRLYQCGGNDTSE